MAGGCELQSQRDLASNPSFLHLPVVLALDRSCNLSDPQFSPL